MRNHVIAMIFLILSVSCHSPGSQDLSDEAEKQILEAEEAFDRMAGEKGIRDAFLAFAAEDAVLNRNSRIISGKQAIQEFFDSQDQSANVTVSLSWKPDFVKAAASGDLGYTWGRYTYSVTDSTGRVSSSNGAFHTVWERQADGTWKFVYD